MIFKLQVQHIAEDEAGLAAFIIFLRDTFTNEVIGASANSENKNCIATFQFPSLNDVIQAIQALKTNFTIKYRMNYQP